MSTPSARKPEREALEVCCGGFISASTRLFFESLGFPSGSFSLRRVGEVDLTYSSGDLPWNDAS
eukprot:854945-Amphidinium_carterae.1